MATAKRLNFKRFAVIILGLVVLILAASLISMRLGSVSISCKDCLLALREGIFGGESGIDDVTLAIIWKIRLPRIILAFIVGAALSIAGATFQALLRNPLADPHLLGVSAGGALGAVMAIIFGVGIFWGSLWLLPGFSFIGSIVAIFLVYALSRRKEGLSIYTLLLVGVVLNAFFISIIIFVQSMVNSDELASILFWLLGSLNYTSYRLIFIVAIFVLMGSIVLFTQARSLNIVTFGEEKAKTLGVSTEATKRICFIFSSLIVGVCVSISGLIGFVGLVVPHLVRLIFGPDHRLLLPASALLGGALLILSDTLARVALLPNELPVGVVTSFLGAPFFILLLKKREVKRVF